MYFLEQILKQQNLLIALHAWVEWLSEVQQDTKPKTPEAQKTPREVLDKAEKVNNPLDKAVSVEAERISKLKWDWNETVWEWKQWNDKISEVVEWDHANEKNEWGDDKDTKVSEESEQDIELADEKLLEWISEKPPFNTLTPEERQEVFDQIMEEWFEVPEWMTREEAFEQAFNDSLEKEPTEYNQRIDKILQDEAIELSKEQRQALNEFLEGIDDPTIEDMHQFLQENNIEGFSVQDNPNTIADESRLPIPNTRLNSSRGDYSSLPSNGGSWNWENPYTWKAFEGEAWLDSEIYNIQRLKQKMPADRLAHAENLEKQLVAWMPSTGNKDNWLWALYRNASNNENFSSNQPVLLHNLSTATALVMVDWNVTICEATHGKWVGNGNGKHGTPIGSFEMYGMTNGKYQARMWVKWLEPMKQNINNDTTENAANMDPADIGNANSDNRLIRVHESRWSQTEWCTGLPTEVAKMLADATRAARIGIMERFVSRPIT